MQKVSMFEAKTNLSKLVERARQGEEVILTCGRERKPVARIIAIDSLEMRRRPLGLFEGMFEVGREFFEPLPDEELRRWNGEGE